ncbi:neuronal PAS domain-containing protein 4B [Anguilla anguilla]|uniref:neuronal PAS domain-containing protein 4B n=1 Tax=Anguilla anguilla TaxID=7936 RepID=UPI0015B2BDDD|nr:neuronal PAS domain-containing protein 4B [Anguilla anguilla]
MYRSTKGASKARRDQINAEIRNLKELLPISEVDKARLSYLHIMSLACMYTRKSVFFSQETETTSGQEESSRFMSSQELSQLVQELPGFLLMLTSEGKLLYLSDSVTEHLGHSMVDLVAQGDSVYDIIDPTDHFVMRSNLSPTTSPDTDRLFRCRFNTSKSARRQSAGTRLTLVRALCLSTPGAAASSYWTSNPAWLCFCSPLESQPSSPGTRPTLAPPADHAFFLAGFHSRHGQDMRVRDADDSVSVYLGYDVEALRSRSWYSLVHPQDLPHASAQHCSLLSEGSEGRAEMVVRVETQDGSFTWLYMVLHLETGDSPISCRSYIISESEAWSVRQQLCTEQTQLALVLSASASYQDSLGLRSPDTLSSPDQVFTPSSSGLSGQSFDFSAAASTSMSSSEELGGAAAADPMLEGPRSSLSSLEEEGLAQQGGPQQPPPPPESGDSAAGTPPTFDADMDVLARSVFRPPPQMPPPPPPLTRPQQGEGFTCSPRYAPQAGRGGVSYREVPFISAPSACAPRPVSFTRPLLTPAGRPLSLPLSAPCPAPWSAPCSASQQVLLSLEPYRGPLLYEKLPPTPDTPEEGDCGLLPLPLTLPPLYVDVPPQGLFGYALEGLLTPEASPTELPHPLEAQIQGEAGLEQERAEISYLAQQISTLAESFSSKLCSSSSPTPLPIAPPTKQDPISPLGEIYPVKQLDPPLSQDKSSLFEESMLESFLLDFLLNCAPPSTPPPPLSCPSPSPQALPTPPAPACWCPHLGVCASHICSVQSTHCNGVVGGGAMAGTETVDMETEPSSVSESPAVPATPIAPAATPSLPRVQPLLGELVTMEPVFGAGASIAPVLGQQPELHQLHRDCPPQHFQPDGNGSDSSF